MPAKKILCLVGDFAEDYEVMVPFQALTMVGHVVHAVCPGKKAGEQIKNDFPNILRTAIETEAWKHFSDAFGRFPYSAGMTGFPYWRGPFYLGPAHPFLFDLTAPAGLSK